MRTRRGNRLVVEELESRLAPAVFFLSGTALTVEDAAGNNAQNSANENAAHLSTGATAAILMSTGDSLVFDSNNNNVRDPQERVLVKVTAGRAMVFFSDGFGPTGLAFDENEISGLAVSGGFSATINTDVNGSITTTLDAAGAFTGTTLQNTSIAGLTIAGRVLGDIVAGKNISNVRIGSGLFTPTPEQSVAEMRTGSAGNNDIVNYSFSASDSAAGFKQPAGTAGGHITTVRLD